jgi:uncharacterized protein YjiS (DUF1127 family)
MFDPHSAGFYGIIQDARAARTQAFRDLFLLPIRRMAAGAGAALRRWGRAYATWRTRRQAIAELAGLDDCVLKDFGIHRSEIESVVDGRDLKPRAECEVPAALFHQPYDRPITGARPVTKQPRSWPHCDRGGGGRRIFAATAQ